MKKLLFILFFPITVPVYLMYKFLVWALDELSFNIGWFLRHTLIPKIKKYFSDKSAEMQKNAEKASNDINEPVIETSNEERSSVKTFVEPVAIVLSNNTSEDTLIENETAVIEEESCEKPLIETIEQTYNEPSVETTNVNNFERILSLRSILMSAEERLKTTVTPDTFFKNLDKAKECLYELAVYERQGEYCFFDSPAERLKELLNTQRYTELINKFIEKYWYRILQEATALNFEEARLTKINSFQDGLTPFLSYFKEENKKYLKQLAETELDLSNLPKPKIEFDESKEKSLLANLENAADALQRHFCYNDLIDFYYKYRNDYPETTVNCIKYCSKDINSIPETSDDYIKSRIVSILRLYSDDKQKQDEKIAKVQEQGFNVNYPAFDRITMLFYYGKDYDSAIYYCKLAIENGQDYDMKYTKRLKRFENKRAAEEK